MRNGKIDIIIPAYNVKDDLLFTCLSSIATQTLRDISKVTIVDDASTV
jgi:glycosyltransferase involved in cell wall biosynthesis